jgi:hypothetical protein
VAWFCWEHSQPGMLLIDDEQAEVTCHTLLHFIVLKVSTIISFVSQCCFYEGYMDEEHSTTRTISAVLEIELIN